MEHPHAGAGRSRVGLDRPRRDRARRHLARRACRSRRACSRRSASRAPRASSGPTVSSPASWSVLATFLPAFQRSLLAALVFLVLLVAGVEVGPARGSLRHDGGERSRPTTKRRSKRTPQSGSLGRATRAASPSRDSRAPHRASTPRRPPRARPRGAIVPRRPLRSRSPSPCRSRCAD